MASIPADYRTVTLVQKQPPDEVLRHAEMVPGESGRYGKVVRYKLDRAKTVYEVLLFKAGRPPTREEVLDDLRQDLVALDAQLEDLKTTGRVSRFLDRLVFQEPSAGKLEGRRREIEETIEAVQEDYQPGESVPIP
ncbi:MAG: hypothetical protein M5U26_16665 [Planctomycetota bacterium]|nr:hypothetical protein [Planctomycetota bacterium]